MEEQTARQSQAWLPGQPAEDAMSAIGAHDSREREPRAGEYTMPAVCNYGSQGRIACYRQGLKLIDFYWTNSILCKDWVEPEKKGQS